MDQGSLKFLIPVSDARMNFAAVLKPFQLYTGIFLLLRIKPIIQQTSGYLIFNQLGVECGFIYWLRFSS